MKLNGTYTLREVAGEVLVIPVGATAMELNGMIILNPVSKVIWECLEKGTEEAEILKAVLERFDVTEETAKADIGEILDQLRKQKLITE